MSDPEILAKKLWPRVLRDDDGCWVWIGQRSSNGFGRFRICEAGKYSSIAAHRASYIINVGELSDHFEVRQSCGNKLCVRPDHLSLVPTRGSRKDQSDESIEETFWSRVSVGTDGECWPWKHSRLRDGYGLFDTRRLGSQAAHRLAYQFKVGAIPDGMQVMHSCDNRRCCNPKHLSVGTNRENALDMMRKGRGRNGFGPIRLKGTG